ncbi:MAG: HypC/HybG/HupF family hydrogenase formation chaperone [Candidatus Thermoplasmatota archaeon]
MCLAIPGRIVEISNEIAKVDFGGVLRDVNISLVDAKPGLYVIVHAGFAIQVLDELEAKKTLKIFEEILRENA